MSSAHALNIPKEKKQVEKPKIKGFEALVATVRKQVTQIEEIQKQIKAAKEIVLNSVRLKRDESEREGKLFKTFIIESEDGEPGIVQYKNQYKKLPIDNLAKMHEALSAGVFDRLYEVVETISFKKDSDLELLQKLLGERFWDFFEKEITINHQSDFMEKRMAIRSELNTQQNRAVDDYTSQTQSKPDLRVKATA